MTFPKGSEYEFNKWLVSEYLKCGSVDEVFKIHRYGIPVSYANYQRILDRWNIVKAAGPNNKLTEALEFLSHLAEHNIPFEKLYTKMPPSFRTSAATLYRVLSYIKEGVTRRVGTGLMITPWNSQEKILVGKDVSTPRIELGKPFGSITIPMGFSRKRDSREMAILRILQQEVFTDYVVNGKTPDIIPVRPKPFMFLDIVDVRVEVFWIKLPKIYSKMKCFSSYKLQDFKFMGIQKMMENKDNFRIGMKDVAKGYNKYIQLLGRNIATNPLFCKSDLNFLLTEAIKL
ncbi:hypothetical protein A2686_00840 [Candidatus Woesebacteria bacterium RIFCSPHIGHO2_01_FULL_38_10]|uniref:Uncharacterized protein n=1 Tax=Candidatus Woesebacteria bacterium RIFCSPLOWO2_01_FULL_39_10b TaxID=1802517 RepID=A0A1F8B9E0_9BACT|nr:MAG: hypothetical protein A2686_00840 [Candidatus Woesebacteria bacterium RIFCSPHIGHO2_01_FULL_38_10]OGM60653.1 MAG: hypothetical protein A2892_01235 [Candidatus Woesebacteria bacterium RIFCSPLOWO2_01_FULL_39_10b]